MTFAELSQWAEEEISSLILVLPDDVREVAERLAVSFEEKPGSGIHDASLIGDELGLFEGASHDQAPLADVIPRIRLFVSNLWDWVEHDEQDFRDEVGTTFLHELGHYLGWDEEDVEERGLE